MAHKRRCIKANSACETDTYLHGRVVLTRKNTQNNRSTKTKILTCRQGRTDFNVSMKAYTAHMDNKEHAAIRRQ